MNMEERIARINALYHKSQKEGLTDQEKMEQQILRQEYIQSIRSSLKAQLDNIDIENEDGSITNLGEKYGKKQIRDEILAVRSTLSDEACMEKSAVILKQLGRHDAYLSAYKVGLYASYGQEVITYPMIARSLMLDKGVSFPRILSAAERKMEFRYILRVSDLKPGYKGILEPGENATIMQKPDLIVMPLVAFDTQRNRIGQGGGFYDAYLSEHPDIVKIALAYECQRVDMIPSEDFDVRPDIIITEEKIYE